MADVIALGSARGRLCGEIAAAIARSLTAESDAEPGSCGASFYHESDPHLEAATRLLRELGLAAPLRRADRPGEDWYCLHALTLDATAMPAALAQRPDAATLVDRALPIALRMAAREGLPVASGWQDVPTEFVALAQALARAGYQEIEAGRFRWLPLVGPEMREAGLWEADGAPPSTESERRAQALAAWKSMPETLRRTCFGTRRMPFVAFVELLGRSWREGRWQAVLSGDIEPPASHIGLARHIFALAEDRA